MRFLGELKKSIAVMGVVAMGLSLVSVADIQAAPVAKLSKTKFTITAGKSKTLKVTAKKIKKVTWKTSKKKVATVTKKKANTAVVKAKAAGKAVIKATVKLKNGKKKTLTCKVTVKNADVVTPTVAPTAAPTAAPTVAPTVVAPTAAPTAEPTIPGPTPLPELDMNNLAVAEYPGIFSDVPDLDIIRVGGNYYMVSTTMNMCPGVPIMKSTDLVHWQIVNYVYDTFADDDRCTLSNGKDMYRNGSWAASIKYYDGLYYVAFNCIGQGFFIYTTDDIENGEWIRHNIDASFHDPGLFIEDGRIFVVYGGENVQELAIYDEDESIERVGESQKIITKSKDWTLHEGSHVYKVGDYYYITIIASPAAWFRTQICYRSKDLFSTEWEEKIIYQGSTYEYGTGLAQGGIVDTIYGDWYGFAFQDHDGVGRIPSFVAVEWQDDWPMFGTYDADGNFLNNQANEPLKIKLNDSGLDNYFVGDDDFTYSEGEKLKLVWQWNHNPDNDNWSVLDNPGYYRITNGRTADNVWRTRNSLTQRTYGPNCVSETAMLSSGMKPGDYAGLVAVGNDYGMVGVMCDENGDRYVFQGSEAFDKPIKVNEQADKIEGDAPVYLKAEYAFNTGKTRADKVDFYYSLDGTSWTKIGKQLSISFSTSTTFMGARTWLSNYATTEAGGYVDFDYYKIYN